jgi:hypothetical protein
VIEIRSEASSARLTYAWKASSRATPPLAECGREGSSDGACANANESAPLAVVDTSARA